MVDDLTGDEDGMAGKGIGGGDEERTSPEPRMVRLAAASSAEARKGN
jgi:hypothetical protein